MQYLDYFNKFKKNENVEWASFDDNAEVGKRVKLIKMDDPHSKLKEGDEGTIRHIDDIGTIHVNWDSGSSLGLIPGEDEYEILEENYNGILDDMGYTRGDSMDMDDMVDRMESDMDDYEELELDIKDFIDEISIERAQDLGFKGFIDLYNEEYPYYKIYNDKMDFARRVYNKLTKDPNQKSFDFGE